MAQEQSEEGTEGVSPRHPNVARRLGLEPDSPELAIGERYLEEQGYIRPSSPGEKGGPFIITEAGLEDLGYQHSVGGGTGNCGSGGWDFSTPQPIEHLR
jgi:hypothetical protein